MGGRWTQKYFSYLISVDIDDMILWYDLVKTDTSYKFVEPYIEFPNFIKMLLIFKFFTFFLHFFPTFLYFFLGHRK